MDDLIGAAREAGPIPVGQVRVVAFEDGMLNLRDFADRDAANRYADDLVAEHGAAPCTALVLDDAYRIVHRGRAYFAS